MNNLLQPLIRPELARERTAEDPDIVDEVYQRLAKGGWTGAALWLDEPEIARAKTSPPDLQRYQISRNLNARFCGIGIETRIERIMLNAQSPIEEYLDNLEKYIGPALEVLYPLTPKAEG